MKRHVVSDFLSLHLNGKSKLLLALSGGPDSMALLYLLLESLETCDFYLHLAHVNHGWRVESDQEAQLLMKLAKQLKLPFHLHTLKGVRREPDMENRCRKERLLFFTKLYHRHHFQAILLAHHSGDQAETVLKRVFEGAGLRALGGLRAIRHLGGVPIWRPLLSCTKDELRSYLDQNHIFYFEDETNRDPKYLRSRMRERIFPKIEQSFGKNIRKNCLRLGSLCLELSEYFEEKCRDIEQGLIYGPFGECLSLDFHYLELKFFLKEYAQRMEAHFSHEALNLLIDLIRQKKENRQVHAPPLIFYVNSRYLFIVREAFPNFFEEKERWVLFKSGSGTWRNFWQGELPMPEDGVQMGDVANLESRVRSRLTKWYLSHDVPSFFYRRAPIFIREGKIVGECLTGRRIIT